MAAPAPGRALAFNADDRSYFRLFAMTDQLADKLLEILSIATLLLN
jgi:hypothetical protein